MLEIACIGSALMAGFFFAFSVCVMRALARVPPETGLTVMQTINEVVINPWFILPFLGLGMACAWLGVSALRTWGDPHAPYWLAGSALYLVGALAVTIGRNVPLNDALAKVRAGDPFWNVYLSTWTRWNHVRTIAPLLASIAFALGR